MVALWHAARERRRMKRGGCRETKKGLTGLDEEFWCIGEKGQDGRNRKKNGWGYCEKGGESVRHTISFFSLSGFLEKEKMLLIRESSA